MRTPRTHPELVDRLVEGVQNLTSSERWRRHLEIQSRFHHYSFHNALLIATQRPDASVVAGFNRWRALDRTVRRGEHAIWILAPMVRHRSRTATVAPADDTTDDTVTVVRGFKFVPVFDVAQTEGPELPTVCDRLQGEDPFGLFDRLLVVAGRIGFEVVDHHFGGATNGDCSHTERRIRVESSNQPAQRTKTLAHELAHAMLHAAFSDRALAELEAESTAYVVCQALGLDTGNYSFGYVAQWAGGGDPAMEAIKASGARIQRAASAILDAAGVGKEGVADRSGVRAA